ncbi:hypothetical protein HPB48_019835 [Haemaphysalis longicornis]|uniref:Uncharacterized protein n=1 Tax=Haemaphysalis longicornis TaxID=44386 RepID=A0A9J6FBV5_HAELO|nr:hypothetical protein HPB48_019835 [Haemaphysalis longicornis]
MHQEEAEAGEKQPLEPPKELEASAAAKVARHELLGAEGVNEQPGEIAMAEAKDNPRASGATSGAGALEKLSVSSVVGRGSSNLGYRWCLWFQGNDERRSWEDNLMEVTSFQTLEDFWTLHNHIERASNLHQGCAYALFRYGIEPSMGGPRNRNGGQWIFTVERGRRDLDSTWLQVLLCLVTDKFGEHSADVCGAVLQVRSEDDVIAVWTTNKRNEVANIAVGRTLEEQLMLLPGEVITFRSHADIAQPEGGDESVAKYEACCCSCP